MGFKPSYFTPLLIAAAAAASIAVAPIAAADQQANEPVCTGNQSSGMDDCWSVGDRYMESAGGTSDTGPAAPGADPAVPLGTNPSVS